MTGQTARPQDAHVEGEQQEPRRLSAAEIIGAVSNVPRSRLYTKVGLQGCCTNWPLSALVLELIL